MSSYLSNTTGQPSSYTITQSSAPGGYSSVSETTYATSYSSSTPAETALRSSYTAPQTTLTVTAPAGYTSNTTSYTYETSGSNTGAKAPGGYGNLSLSYSHGLSPSKAEDTGMRSSATYATATPLAGKETQQIGSTEVVKRSYTVADTGSVPQTSYTTNVSSVSQNPPTATVNQKIDATTSPTKPAGQKSNQGGMFNTQGIENRTIAGLKTFQDFLNLRAKLGFHLLNAKDAVLAIRDRIGHINHLTLDEFIMVFTDLFRGKFANFYEFVEQLSDIFQFVDVNGNGSLEMGETLQAFVHLFGGSEEDKIRAAFYLFDLDNSGFLDQKEVYTMIYNTIRLAHNTDQTFTDDDERKFVQIAEATTADVFRTMDVNNDQKVSIDEFLAWYKGSEGQLDKDSIEHAKKMRAARLEELKNQGIHLEERDHEHESEQRSKIYKTLEETKAFTHLIDEIREKIPFQHIHIHPAMDLLKNMFPTFTCNIHQFSKYINKLIEMNHLDGKENTYEITRKLFNAIDENRNGILDLSELTTGLSLLCGGSQADKVKASFDLYDENQDSALEFTEMCHLMLSFFKFIQIDTPLLVLANENPENFAYALALKVFEETHTPLNKSVPFPDFLGWFSAISRA